MAIEGLSVKRVLLLLQNQFDGLRVLEQDEATTTRLVCIMFPVDHGSVDRTELGEVVTENFFGDILGDAADEDFSLLLIFGLVLCLFFRHEVLTIELSKISTQSQ